MACRGADIESCGVHIVLDFCCTQDAVIDAEFVEIPLNRIAIASI
jgi:hypothetical protein